MQPLAPTSELRCPYCQHAELLPMPIDACVVIHQCSACQSIIRPEAGDCCVFCSHGTVPCPPMQRGECGGSSQHCA